MTITGTSQARRFRASRGRGRARDARARGARQTSSDFAPWRVKKDCKTSVFLLVLEIRTQGIAIGTYVDENLAQINSDGSKHFFIQDRRYSTTALLDASGNVEQRFVYDPYGKTLVLSASGVATGAAPLTDVLWTGRRLDSESGVYYFRSRYFSVTLGRFISRDRDYLDGWNLYGAYFAMQMAMDPSGEIKQGDTLDITFAGEKVGVATVDKYVEAAGIGSKGADIKITVNITEKGKCPKKIFRWEQKNTIKDQKGNFLKFHDVVTDGTNFDPQPPDDDKDWYWTNKERPGYLSADGVSETFDDTPRLSTSRLNKDVTEITNSFVLNLMAVDNEEQKNGGDSVLSVAWGYVYTETNNALIK